MSRVLSTLLLFALMGGLSTGVQAQERPRPITTASDEQIGQISIQMLVVHATDSQTGVDPRLKSLESSFRYFKYKGYILLNTQNSTIGLNESTNFTIEGGRKVKVTLLSVDTSRARVRVEITSKDDKLLDTTVSINRDGTFIVAGPRYGDGILMLPLQASY